MPGINGNAIHRADFHALAGFEMTDAFGAQLPVNFINDFPLIDSVVGAFWFADITVDALICYKQCHDLECSGTKFIYQRGIDFGMNKLADVAAIFGNFFYEAG